jgi:hypothetical protein
VPDHRWDHGTFVDFGAPGDDGVIIDGRAAWPFQRAS